jgi:hypothetical protein
VLLPRVTVREDGETEIEKLGVPAWFTTKVTVVAWVRLPLVPVMLSV